MYKKIAAKLPIGKNERGLRGPSEGIKGLPSLPQKREGGATIGRPNHLAFTNFGELYFQKITIELPGNVSSPCVIHRVCM